MVPREHSINDLAQQTAQLRLGGHHKRRRVAHEIDNRILDNIASVFLAAQLPAKPATCIALQVAKIALQQLVESGLITSTKPTTQQLGNYPRFIRATPFGFAR